MERMLRADLARRVFSTPTARLALLRAAWPVAVGPELARRTEVLALEGRSLRVRVPDTRWKKTLHRMSGQILPRLREISGSLAPLRLGFTTGPVKPMPALPPRRSPEHAPAVEPPAAVVAEAQAIEDPELRRQFLKTAAAYLGRPLRRD
jgi:hypothetical protein